MNSASASDLYFPSDKMFQFGCFPKFLDTTKHRDKDKLYDLVHIFKYWFYFNNLGKASVCHRTW